MISMITRPGISVDVMLIYQKIYCFKVLAPSLLQQADIRVRSHGLRQLVDDKSVVS